MSRSLELEHRAGMARPLHVLVTRFRAVGM